MTMILPCFGGAESFKWSDMRPIEIRIEGYKIVITKEDEKQEQPNTKAPNVITYPAIPCGEPSQDMTGDWWQKPNATWVSGGITYTNTTDAPKATGGTVAGSTYTIDHSQTDCFTPNTSNVKQQDDSDGIVTKLMKGVERAIKDE